MAEQNQQFTPTYPGRATGTNASGPTDELLAREALTGNTQAFGALVERYEPKLLRYAQRFLFGYEDREDAVQEVFLKAYANLAGFDPARNFSAWIYRIAHNEFINTIRKKGKEPLPFFDPDTLFPHPVEPKKADDDLKEDDLRQMLNACLSQLKPKYREVLVLYYYEDMDYRSISDILRVPLATVGIRLKRGKTALQNAYKKLRAI